MALKDLVSDLSNFKGQSQYDGLDSQIKKGVDYFPNDSLVLKVLLLRQIYLQNIISL